MVLSSSKNSIKYFWVCIVTALLCAAPIDGRAQQFETPPPSEDTPRPAAYLPEAAIDFRAFLASPPEPDSIADFADRAGVLSVQERANAARWQDAESDAAYVYARFALAFGRPIDRGVRPNTITLLNRTLRDVANIAFKAKGEFQRARPFQRFQLKRICGKDPAPPPDPNPKDRSSYPSGHSAYGWAVALVLAQVAPERAPALMAKAAEYGESRVVCGVHFPSDVEAGHAIAIAVVDRLQSSPKFQQDLQRARKE